MKKSYFIIFILILLTGKNICQGQPLFNFDYAIFRGENGNSILEIYYSVDQSSLIYSKTTKGFESAAKVNVNVFDNENNKNLYSNSYKTPSVVTDTSGNVLNQKLVGQLNYVIPEGNYKIKIIGTDISDTTKPVVYELNLNVNEIANNKIEMSDMQFSTMIENSTDNKSMFYKNTIEVIPNPSNLFGMNLKDLYYYYEIYGLIDENISEEFSIDYSVLDLNNAVVLSHNEKVKKTAEAKAKFGKFRIDSLNRGTYTFRITIKDSNKNVSLSKEKKFYIYNKSSNIGSVSTTGDDFLKSEYGAMTEDQVNEEFEKSQYIMNEAGIEKFESLTTLDDKRKFLFAFWKSKDISDNTPRNEYKIEYFKRVAEANELYKEPYKEGWKTDRGRVYIIYGKPDDVQRHPFESTTKSYEIWRYDAVEGGGECVFVEKQPTTGVYWMVHSTFRNELKNDSWRSELIQ